MSASTNVSDSHRMIAAVLGASVTALVGTETSPHIQTSMRHALFIHWIFVCICCCVLCCEVTPLDVVKTRLQSQAAKPGKMPVFGSSVHVWCGMIDCVCYTNPRNVQAVHFRGTWVNSFFFLFVLLNAHKLTFIPMIILC